jgi:cell division transport system permease protein
MQAAAERIVILDAIDDVIYDRELLDLLQVWQGRFALWGIILAVLVLVVAAGLTFNSIRLKIHTQQDAIDLLSLLGTTSRSLNAIFWVQGMILGLLGGIIGWIVIFWIIFLLQLQMPEVIRLSLPHSYLLMILGMLMGATSGALAVKRHLKF